MAPETGSADPSPERDSFQTADGLRLDASFRETTYEARAVVVIVHGLAEHRGRYGRVVAHLLAHGYTVAAYDQRGYGHSEGRRAYVSSFSLYLADLARFVGLVRERYPALPVFLLGQSLGGLIVACYALEHPRFTEGLILCSPAILSDIAPFLQRISAFISRLLPSLPTVALDLPGLSRDPEVVRVAREDPLFYHGKIPARTGAEIVAAMRRVQNDAPRLTLPMLILHGTADRITVPAGSELLYHRAASGDKTLKLYDGLYHETFNEPERARVLGDITAWLDAHTRSQTKAG